MVMLSELLRFRLVDGQGNRSTLVDLAVRLLDVDYPPVTHLIYRQSNLAEAVLPWRLVKGMDRAHRQIHVETYDGAKDIEALGQAVRLQREVLDALILDLQNRRVTRANDLWLEEKDKQLRLSAVDISAYAVLRRLTQGWYRGVNRRTLYDWKYVEFLRGDPQAVKAGAGYHRRIVHLPPGEIAHLAAAIPYLHAAELLELLPEQLAADTLEVMSPERQLQVIEELEENHALQLLTLMSPDLATDIVGRLDVPLAQHYLNRMPRKYAERIIELLRYPENTVGSIMTNDVVTISPTLKVGQARQMLRDRLKEPDFVHFLYVIEDEESRKLRGVLSLRHFLMAEDDQVIEKIMNPYLIVLSPFDSPEEAGYRLLNSQLVAIPVVGANGQLLGTVTIDAAIAQVAPRNWRAQAPRVFS